jgi:drug/metabolite transporter (DMT)-like permease
MMQIAKQHNRTLGFLCCALAGSFWGCGFFFGKIALTEMSVGHMVFYRFVFAVLGLLPLIVTRRPNFSAKEWRTLLIGSLLGVPVQFLLQFRGLSMTTVSHAALMVGTMPVILALGAVVFAHERLPKLGWVALAGSTVGAGLIALGGSHTHTANGPTLAGDLLTVVSVSIALFWILINKRLMETHDHLVISAYGLLLGTAMLAVWVPFSWGMPPVHGVSLKVWAALIGSGLLCTATTTLLWNWGMTQVPASEAGILLNMEPLIGSLLGVFVLHERLGGWAWLGGALILVSAVVLTTRGPAAPMAEGLLAES